MSKSRTFEEQNRISISRPMYFDITTTAERAGRTTGISRVELALAQNLKNILGNRIRFVIYHSEQFYEYKEKELTQNSISSFYYLLTSNRAQNINPIYPEKASLFLVSGSSWMQNPRYAKSVVRFSASMNAPLGLVVFDLVPLLFPYWYKHAFLAKFTEALHILLDNAAIALCISKNTELDLTKYCLDNGLKIPKTSVIRLGDQIDDSNLLLDKFDGEIERGKYILAVGAIHKRKNYEVIFAAYKLLLERGLLPPKLIIVGGWMEQGREIARIALEDQDLASSIIIRANVNDAELVGLYENCLFTVYPSGYEGWGLPVCESFRYGKLCLASDRASIPEILPGYPHLLDPQSPKEWAARILHFSNCDDEIEDVERWIANNYVPHSWLDCADQIVRQDYISKPVECDQEIDRYTGEFNLNESKYDVVLSSDWGVSEPWGRWTLGCRADLSIPYPEYFEQNDNAILELELKSPIYQQIIIEIDEDFRRLLFVGLEASKYLFLLGERNYSSDVEVRFTANSIAPISSAGPSVGVGVGQIRWLAERNLIVERELNGSAIESRRLVLRDNLKFWNLDNPHNSNSLVIYAVDEFEIRLHVFVDADQFIEANCSILINGQVGDAIIIRGSQSKIVKLIIPAGLVDNEGRVSIEVVALDTNQRQTTVPIHILEYCLDSTKMLLPPPGYAAPFPLLELGTTVLFGKSEDSEQMSYLDFGWRSLGSFGVRSAGEVVTIGCLVDCPIDAWRAIFNLKIVSSAGLSRRVAFYCNGEFIDTAEVSCNKLGSVAVQSALPIRSIMQIEIRICDALPDETFTLRYFSIDQFRTS